MKKLVTMMLALSFLTATVAVTYAADDTKQDTGKKKKGKKKKTEEPKAAVR
jgi:Ni/Co efflux regulator RcnB